MEKIKKIVGALKDIKSDIFYKALAFKNYPGETKVFSGYVVDTYFADVKHHKVYDVSYFDKINNLEAEYED